MPSEAELNRRRIALLASIAGAHERRLSARDPKWAMISGQIRAWQHDASRIFGWKVANRQSEILQAALRAGMRPSLSSATKVVKRATGSQRGSKTLEKRDGQKNRLIQAKEAKQRRRLARANIASEVQERVANPGIRLVADHKGQILTSAEVEDLKENRDDPIQLRGNS